MTCPDCAASEVGLWAGFTRTCERCRARMVARSMPCWASRQAGKLTCEYVRLLQKTGLTHQQVKDAGALDFEAAVLWAAK